jgi:hypothetical protein
MALSGKLFGLLTRTLWCRSGINHQHSWRHFPRQARMS